MGTSFIKNIPLAAGEITIVKGRHAADIMRYSCEMARSLQKKGIGSLIVNTGLSINRFREAAKTAGIDWPLTEHQYGSDQTNTYRAQYKYIGNAPLLIHNSYAGDLIGEMALIYQIVIEAKVSVVFITSWEWSSEGWRRKERLMFALRKLLEERQIVLVVFSQSRTNTIAGEYDRGGVGKLATIAGDVVELEPSEKLAAAVQRVSPIAFRDEEEQQLFAGSAQLVSNEINKIPGVLSSSEAPEILRPIFSDIRTST
ncbi:MAG TPA: hypothetical protein VFO76_00855 [Candidatus Kapabacteria bacterium]|nr:hypothetical protein [Candidatus Kapabacteria bacterium]